MKKSLIFAIYFFASFISLSQNLSINSDINISVFSLLQQKTYHALNEIPKDSKSVSIVIIDKDINKYKPKEINAPCVPGLAFIAMPLSSTFWGVASINSFLEKDKSTGYICLGVSALTGFFTYRLYTCSNRKTNKHNYPKPPKRKRKFRFHKR